MFSEIDVPKIKETNQDFLDNSSANMNVIVDREKILGKGSEYKIFRARLTYTDFEDNRK
jgi:hypothetical protein